MTNQRKQLSPSTPRPNQGMAIFGKRYRLGSILGFEIAIDASWIFIALLVTWSLAAGLFPTQYENLDTATYWIMGVAGALGLFMSIVLHELSHSLVARRHGVEMRGITLFIFGGVAHMGDEPSTPKAEFLVAIAGPIASVLIGAAFFGLSQLFDALAAPVPLTGVLLYLGYINGLLVAFNLLPAFPLDGGRVLRAILWRSKNNLRQATRISSQVGSGFGIALIVLGVFAIMGGGFIGGMWWVLIGFFLRNVARMSYQQVVMREALQGEPVRRFMRADPHTVRSGTSLASLVEDFFYRDYHKMYPVVDNGHLAGCVTIEQVKNVPKGEWSSRTVGDLATPCTDANSIQSDTDAVEALSLMRRTGTSRLLVMEGDQLVGILTLKDLLQFLAAKIELEEN